MTLRRQTAYPFISCTQLGIERCEFAAKGSIKNSEGTDFVRNLNSVPTLYSVKPCIENSHSWLINLNS